MRHYFIRLRPCAGSKYEAYLLGLLSVQNFRLPNNGILIGADALTNPEEAITVARNFAAAGHPIYALPGMLDAVRLPHANGAGLEGQAVHSPPRLLPIHRARARARGIRWRRPASRCARCS